MQLYLTVERVKKHLNVDDFFHDDDAYIADLITVAQTVVEKHIDDSLSNIAKANGGELPPPLLHAMLLLTGNFYNSRESVAFASSAEIPLSYQYILDLYKNYDCKNNNDCKCECSDASEPTE